MFNLKEQIKRFLEGCVEKNRYSYDEMTTRANQISAHFHQVKQPVESDSVSSLSKRQHLRLVAFVRSGHESLCSEQEKEIIEYCETHHHKVASFFGRHTMNATALNNALDALHDADGLIVTDMMRLFCHDQDPVRRLKDQVKESFFRGGKRLIAIHDGIDTATADGQAKLLHFLRELEYSAMTPAEGLHKLESDCMEGHGTMYEFMGTSKHGRTEYGD